MASFQLSNVRLSDYDLAEVLGVGTVGTIYRAIDTRSGEAVAVKILMDAVSRDQVIAARFEREMVILERLSHPHIVRYFGGGSENGRLFYVMELINGGTVKDLLESTGPLTWPEVVTCGKQIASALQCAHNHGVIHRDLKPANLFLTREGVLKLGDFGIARDATRADITASGLTVGTHAYMAPEQITGSQSISGKADLYSLGCCLYEMLTATKAFDGDNFAQIFHSHLSAPPPRVRALIPEVPEVLEQLIVSLLAKKPEDRPFNARAVQGVLLSLADSFPPLTAKQPRRIADDTPAPQVTPTDSGHDALVARIGHRFGERAERDVSWPVLGAVAAAIVLATIAAMALSNQSG